MIPKTTDLEQNNKIVAEEPRQQIRAVRMRLIPGLKVWQMAPDGAIDVADFVELKLEPGKRENKRVHRLKVQENYRYRQSLNAKNALRKFQKVNPKAFIKTTKHD